MTDIGRMRAARALARGSTNAAAAREAGVDRATIGRWVKDPAFQDLILKASEPEVGEDAAESATKGLADLVPQAIKVLEDALAGGNVTPAAARVALDIVKAAKQLEPVAAAEGPSTLTTLIAELDARQAEAAAG